MDNLYTPKPSDHGISMPMPLISQAQRVRSELQTVADRVYSDLTEGWLTRATATLAAVLSGSGFHKEALDEASFIVSEAHQAVVLATILPFLPENLRPGVEVQIIQIVRSFENKELRSKALTIIAPLFSVQLKAEVAQEALSMAKTVESVSIRENILAQIAPILASIGRSQQALAVALEINDVRRRGATLRSLVSVVSQQSLPAVADAIRSLEGDQQRIVALTALASYVPETQYVQEALTASYTSPDPLTRSRTLAILAQHLTEPIKSQVLRDALDAAERISNQNSRVAIFISILPSLEVSVKEEVLRQSLASVQLIDDESQRVTRLTELAPYLPVPLFQQVLEVIQSLSPVWRGAALASIAASCPALFLPQLLNTARTTQDYIARSVALVGIVTTLSASLQQEILPEAIATAQMIESDYWRAEMLIRLAPLLPELQKMEMLSKVLSIIRMDVDVSARAELLEHVAPILSLPLVQEALEIAHAIRH